MPSIDANGLRIGYDVSGAGPPLVLLHGATSSGDRDFGQQLPWLRRTFRCYLPDARGHGRTRWNADDGFQADWLIDDVAAFAGALDLGPFHLLGFSMGGMTALGLASRDAHRLSTIVVVGIGPELEPRASVARHLMDPARIERDDPTWATDLGRRHDPVQGPGAWRRLLPAIAADVARQPLLTPRQIRSVRQPMLVAVGDRDPFVPVDQAWQLSRSVGDGRLLVLPGARHEAFAERPTLATEALAAFYRSTDTTARRTAGTGPDGSPELEVRG